MRFICLNILSIILFCVLFLREMCNFCFTVSLFPCKLRFWLTTLSLLLLYSYIELNNTLFLFVCSLSHHANYSCNYTTFSFICCCFLVDQCVDVLFISALFFLLLLTDTDNNYNTNIIKKHNNFAACCVCLFERGYLVFLECSNFSIRCVRETRNSINRNRSYSLLRK